MFRTLSIPLAATAAAPTQQDVFRSIQDNVGGSQVDSSQFLYVLLGLVCLIVILAIITQQRKRVVRRKTANHPGKLLREILRAVPLKKRELKQLKLVADNADTDLPVQNPLSLMLCPSVIARTIQKKRLKADRRALISVARKAGLHVAKK
jgi:hypothetical protein